MFNRFLFSSFTLSIFSVVIIVKYKVNTLYEKVKKGRVKIAVQ